MSDNMRKELVSLFIRKTEDGCKAAKNAIAACESKSDSLTDTPQLAELLELLKRKLGQARVILWNQASYFQCLRCTENARQMQEIVAEINELTSLESKRDELESERNNLAHHKDSQPQSKKSLERSAETSVKKIPCLPVEAAPVMLILGYFAVVAYMYNIHQSEVGLFDWLSFVFWPIITLVVLPLLVIGGDGEPIWNAVSLFLIAFAFPVAYVVISGVCSMVNESREERRAVRLRRNGEHLEHVNATSRELTNIERELDNIKREFSKKRQGIVQKLGKIQWERQP